MYKNSKKNYLGCLLNYENPVKDYRILNSDKSKHRKIINFKQQKHFPSTKSREIYN